MSVLAYNQQCRDLFHAPLQPRKADARPKESHDPRAAPGEFQAVLTITGSMATTSGHIGYIYISATPERGTSYHVYN